MCPVLFSFLSAIAMAVHLHCCNDLICFANIIAIKLCVMRYGEEIFSRIYTGGGLQKRKPDTDRSADKFNSTGRVKLNWWQRCHGLERDGWLFMRNVLVGGVGGMEGGRTLEIGRIGRSWDSLRIENAMTKNGDRKRGQLGPRAK